MFGIYFLSGFSFVDAMSLAITITAVNVVCYVWVCLAAFVGVCPKWLGFLFVALSQCAVIMLFAVSDYFFSRRRFPLLVQRQRHRELIAGA